MQNMITKTRFFPASEICQVNQTGARSETELGVSVTLHYNPASPLRPVCAEVYGKSYHAEVGLEWNGNTLTGYDGVFEIPAEVVTMLKDNGHKIDLD